MSDCKKYYYLKLKEGFFDSDEIIMMENMENGYMYSNILLKLYLRSLKNEGKLMVNNRIPYNVAALSQVVRHPVEVVESALAMFERFGLIEILDNGAIYMMDIQNFIGESSTEGDRMRDYRKKVAAAKEVDMITRLGGTDVITDVTTDDEQMNDERTPESELEIELETELELEPAPPVAEKPKKPRKEAPPKKEAAPKHKHGEYGRVLLTDAEFEKLKKEFPDYEYWISVLDEGKELKGYTYKNDYLALRKWRERDLKGHQNKSNGAPGNKETSNPFMEKLLKLEAAEKGGL